MDMQRYKINCLVCNGSSIVEIDKLDRVFWYDTREVISARKRLDMQWGFQCACGNNDIMTRQEKQFITNPQTPDPKEIRVIVDNIRIDEPKFKMEQS